MRAISLSTLDKLIKVTRLITWVWKYSSKDLRWCKKHSGLSLHSCSYVLPLNLVKFFKAVCVARRVLVSKVWGFPSLNLL